MDNLISLQAEKSIAIAYPTCNDFQFDSLTSCIKQNYKNFHVYICDDSTITSYIQMVDQFYEENKQFCQEIGYLKDLQGKYQEEKVNLEKFLNENLEEINFLKKELERSRGLKDEFSTELEKNAGKIKTYQLEVDELIKKLDIISHEKESMEDLELKDQEIIQELEKNNIKLMDENKYQRDYIIKLETQFNFLKNQQNQVLFNFIFILKKI